MKNYPSCPCRSEKPYSDCCRPYHEGKLAEDAQKLMRSRFSAYALDLPEYIIKTTHPASPLYEENKKEWLYSLHEFSRSTQFENLAVLDFKENKDQAAVTFTAYLKQNGKEVTFTELSFFERVQGIWLYRKGHLEEGEAPHLVQEGDLKILPLAFYGDAVLREVAKPIPEITDEIKVLADQMIFTMFAEDGMGLAAPQVHQSLRMFVIRTPFEDAEGNITTGEVKVFINPVISEVSKLKWTAPEGCLSLPGLKGDVERNQEITIEYQNLKGSIVKETVSGWHAKVILHENDHINGILYTDHLSESEKNAIKPQLKRLEERIYKIRGIS